MRIAICDNELFYVEDIMERIESMSFMTRSPPLLMVLYKAPSY